MSKQFSLVLFSLFWLCTTSVFSEPVTIEYAFWGGQADIDIELEIIAAFEAAHPDVKVNILPSAGAGGGSYENKLAALHAAGLAPDVMRLDSYYFADFASVGMIMPIDDLLARTPDFDLNAYFPIALADTTYNGKIYGLPWGSYPRLLFYNRDMFNESGLGYPNLDWSWEEYYNTALKLTRTDGTEITQWGTFVDSSAQWVLPTIWAFGGRMLDESRSEFLMHESNATDALMRTADLVNVARVAPSSGPWQTIFSQGRIAMGSNFLSNAVSFDRQNLPFDWDIHIQHGGPSGQFTVWKGNVTAISSQSQHPEAAWKFLQFLLGPTSEGMKIYIAHKRIAPQTPDAEMWSLFADPARPPVSLASIVQHVALYTARELPVREGWTRFRPLVDQAWQKVLRGELPAQVAMEQIRGPVQQILNER